MLEWWPCLSVLPLYLCVVLGPYASSSDPVGAYTPSCSNRRCGVLACPPAARPTPSHPPAAVRLTPPPPSRVARPPPGYVVGPNPRRSTLFVVVGPSSSSLGLPVVIGRYSSSLCRCWRVLLVVGSRSGPAARPYSFSLGLVVVGSYWWLLLSLGLVFVGSHCRWVALLVVFGSCWWSPFSLGLVVARLCLIRYTRVDISRVSGWKERRLTKANHDFGRVSQLTTEASHVTSPLCLPPSPDLPSSETKPPTFLWKGEGRLGLHPRL
jgi:hypothetical protein